IELRTLVLDTKNNNDLNINHLKLISFISDIIYCKQNNIENPKENIKAWNELISKIDTVLINHNLSTNNWKKPNLNAEEWNMYIDKHSFIKTEINSLTNKFLTQLKTTNLNQIYPLARKI